MKTSARLSVVLGLLGVVALPFAVLAAYETDWWTYLESTWAAIPATVLGVAAIVLGRRGKKRERRAVLPVGGIRVAKWGRRLGWLSLYCAATAGLALAVYGVETYLSG